MNIFVAPQTIKSLTEIENIHDDSSLTACCSKGSWSYNWSTENYESPTMKSENIESNGASYITELPAEIFLEILKSCNLPALVNLSSTCRRLYIWCKYADRRWKKLCFTDFNVSLSSTGKFKSYSEIYRLIYCSRILIGSFIYGRYFNRIPLKPLPHWLMVWAALSEYPPIMKYGKHRVLRRVRGQYLKKFNDIPYGQVKSVFNLSSFIDLITIYPSRQQRGTIYFPWQSVKFAARQKHDDYESFMLEKCYRSRGFIERNYAKVKGSNPLTVL